MFGSELPYGSLNVQDLYTLPMMTLQVLWHVVRRLLLIHPSNDSSLCLCLECSYPWEVPPALFNLCLRATQEEDQRSWASKRFARMHTKARADEQSPTSGSHCSQAIERARLPERVWL